MGATPAVFRGTTAGISSWRRHTWLVHHPQSTNCVPGTAKSWSREQQQAAKGQIPARNRLRRGRVRRAAERDSEGSGQSGV